MAGTRLVLGPAEGRTRVPGMTKRVPGKTVAAYGLYGHIQSNKRRSIALLIGLFFLVYLLVFAGALVAAGADPPCPEYTIGASWAWAAPTKAKRPTQESSAARCAKPEIKRHPIALNACVSDTRRGLKLRKLLSFFQFKHERAVTAAASRRWP